MMWLMRILKRSKKISNTLFKVEILILNIILPESILTRQDFY